MKKKLVSLGIETSCDETAVAIVRGNKMLSNVVASSMHLHKRYGGVVPEIAARYHVEVIDYCFKEALAGPGLDMRAIDIISVTNGPGLIGALLIGISFAKALGYCLDKPVIGVNHVMAHLWANFLFEDRPRLPFIGLAVSGGHTSIIEVRAADKFRLLGQTQDDAAGEAFDKVAKILGLSYPGGPAIDRAAAGHKGRAPIKFTVESGENNSLDFSFSGIKTAVLYHVKKAGGADKLTKADIAAIARGFQEAVCDVIVKKTVLACRKRNIKNLAIGGGVSANSHLRKRLSGEALHNGIKLFIPPLELCLDNAAMTAVLGAELYKKGVRSDALLSGFTNFNS